MKVVTLLNQKGGVGKTSSCHHLAGALARMGRRVLLVDNDPQASLTQGFWGPDRTEALDPAETIAAVYTGEALADRVIRPTEFRDIELVPGSWALGDHNTARPHEADREAQGNLAAFLRSELAPGAYDLVLIDCPPNLHLCSWAALEAADALVIPLQAEDYGSQGLGPVLAFVEQVRRLDSNPGLELLGLLITMFDRRPKLPRLYVDELIAAYGDLVFPMMVPRSVDFAEAVLRRRPVSHLRPKGGAAKAVELVAREVIDRLARLGEPAALTAAGEVG